MVWRRTSLSAFNFFCRLLGGSSIFAKFPLYEPYIGGITASRKMRHRHRTGAKASDPAGTMIRRSGPSIRAGYIPGTHELDRF
jgi:hypothetical protein